MSFLLDIPSGAGGQDVLFARDYQMTLDGSPTIISGWLRLERTTARVEFRVTIHQDVGMTATLPVITPA